MADLKCGVTNCTYNIERLCSKGDIMVGGVHAKDSVGTCCESFIRESGEHDAFTSSITHPSHMISIDCEAEKCIYNSNYKCIADHVDIRGDGSEEHSETLCATFTEK